MEKNLSYEEKLRILVKNCANKLNVNMDDKINSIVENAKKVTPKVAIKTLTQKLLDKFKDENNVLFKSLLNEVFTLNDGSFSTPQAVLEEIKEERKKELEENHKIVNDSLQEVCKKFNELGIDYYIVGALPVYLTAGKMLRKHEDIDFMVAEKDMPKVAEALSTTAYKLHDYRLNSPRVLDENDNLTCGDHEVVANRKDNNFHLGFFMFKREKDGSITQREYHARIDKNGKKVPVLFQRPISKEMFEHNYTEKPIKYLDTYFKTSTPESVYEIKSFMQETDYREKDAFDLMKWKELKKNNNEEDLINEEKVKEIAEILKQYPPKESKSEYVSIDLIKEIQKQQEEMKTATQQTVEPFSI